jgi:hypothetical protein
MPGGVARVVAGDALYRSTLRHGGIAKDVWVLSDEGVDVNVPAVRTASPPIKRATGALASRAADDLYWLGRYAERVDVGGRLLRAAIDRLAGGGLGPRDRAELHLLAAALHRAGWIDAIMAAAPVGGLMFARGLAVASGGGAMGEALAGLRRLTVSVRDRLTLDMWRVLNHVLGTVRDNLAVENGDPDRLLEALDDLVRSIAAFAGLVSENMTRGAILGGSIQRDILGLRHPFAGAIAGHGVHALILVDPTAVVGDHDVIGKIVVVHAQIAHASVFFD